ncbi:hypothetical protein ACFX14_019624 [Malus domestica]
MDFEFKNINGNHVGLDLNFIVSTHVSYLGSVNINLKSDDLVSSWIGDTLIDGEEYTVPMATTEGCLVASTNRGYKAIHMSGGAGSVVLKDGMTRAPVVRFSSAARAAELKFFVDDPLNFDSLAIVFNKSSRFVKLQRIQCSMTGNNLYMRFTCSTREKQMELDRTPTEAHCD